MSCSPSSHNCPSSPCVAPAPAYLGVYGKETLETVIPMGTTTINVTKFGNGLAQINIVSPLNQDKTFFFDLKALSKLPLEIGHVFFSECDVENQTHRVIIKVRRFWTSVHLKNQVVSTTIRLDRQSLLSLQTLQA